MDKLRESVNKLFLRWRNKKQAAKTIEIADMSELDWGLRKTGLENIRTCKICFSFICLTFVSDIAV